MHTPRGSIIVRCYKGDSPKEGAEEGQSPKLEFQALQCEFWVSETPGRLSLLSYDHSKQHNAADLNRERCNHHNWWGKSKVSLGTRKGQYFVALSQQTCPALLMGLLKVKGVPTPSQHHPRSLSLLPLSAPFQWSKGLQRVAKSCRSDKHPAPGHWQDSPLFCVLFKGLDHTTDTLNSCLSKTYPTPAQAGEVFLLILPGLWHSQRDLTPGTTGSGSTWPNTYTLTCHSFLDRVQFVKHQCSYILKHLGKDFFHQ